MKKALSILTAGCLAVSLAACGSTAASSAASAADSTAHTMACAAHSARSSLAEMDGGTIMSGHDQLVLAACQVAPDKGIVLVQRNGVQAALADIAELGKRRALDQALPRYHRDVAGILVHVGGLAHHDGNFLALLQLQ